MVLWQQHPSSSGRAWAGGRGRGTGKEELGDIWAILNIYMVTRKLTIKHGDKIELRMELVA